MAKRFQRPRKKDKDEPVDERENLNPEMKGILLSLDGVYGRDFARRGVGADAKTVKRDDPESSAA